MVCMNRNCPDCGDALIHLTNRGQHESSSAFGQFMHDSGERERAWREMFYMDIDGVIFKKRTGMLRIVEHKPVAGQPSRGQREVLPLLAKSIQMLASTGLVHPQSGVFIINCDPPFDEIRVDQVPGWVGNRVASPVTLTGRPRDQFLCGEEINLAAEPIGVS